MTISGKMSAGYEAPIKRWKLLDSLAISKRNNWEDEKQLLESGLHSQFVDGISQCRELCEQKLERIADIRNVLIFLYKFYLKF